MQARYFEFIWFVIDSIKSMLFPIHMFNHANASISENILKLGKSTEHVNEKHNVMHSFQNVNICSQIERSVSCKKQTRRSRLCVKGLHYFSCERSKHDHRNAAKTSNWAVQIMSIYEYRLLCNIVRQVCHFKCYWSKNRRLANNQIKLAKAIKSVWK